MFQKLVHLATLVVRLVVVLNQLYAAMATRNFLAASWYALTAAVLLAQLWRYRALVLQLGERLFENRSRSSASNLRNRSPTERKGPGPDDIQ